MRPENLLESVYSLFNNSRVFSFIAIAVRIALITPSALGEGNYRQLTFTTDRKFQNPDRAGLQSLQGFGVSMHQHLSEPVAVFLRSDYQSDDAAIDYQWDVSGGAFISGRLWERPLDETGIGYAYLTGGNSDISLSHVFEAYAKFSVCEFANFTFDLQYMEDQLKNAPARKGLMPGIRFVLTY